MSASSREAILARIAEGRPLRAREYAAIPRNYRTEGGLTREHKTELLSERLRDYGCGVHTCAVEGIESTVDGVLRERKKRRLLIAADIPAKWLPGGYEWMRDERLSYRELDAMEGVVTGCALAIAATGTIVLRHSSETGRRACSLIPDYHLCIVFEDQIVELVSEAMREMAKWTRVPVTTISGPSATSDIEMTRVQGVHGPRTLDVLIVR